MIGTDMTHRKYPEDFQEAPKTQRDWAIHLLEADELGVFRGDLLRVAAEIHRQECLNPDQEDK